MAAEPPPNSPSASLAASRRELVVALIGIAAFWIGLASLDGWILLRKSYWMDELCCTVFALRDATSPLDLIGYVRRYDVAPPLFHLLAWPVTKVAGSSPEVVRGVTLACMIAAMTFLYALLRRRFGRAGSVGAIVGVTSHSLLIHHAFDARFYALWTLLAVAYAWALGLDAGKPSRRRDVALGLLAACLCAVHWFGVTSLFLLATGAIAAHGRRWRSGLRLVAPSVAGPATLLLLTPMMLAQLRAGGDAMLWMPPLAGYQLLQMAQLFLLRVPLVVAVLLLLADWLLPARWRRQPAGVPAGTLFRDPSLAGLLALFLMPAVLVAITVVLEPVMWPRYAILSAVAAAPVIALALQTVRRVGYAALMFVFAALVVGFADRELQFASHTQRETDAYAAQLSRARSQFPDVPAVFYSYQMLYSVDGDRRQRSPARVLDLPDSTVRALFPGESQTEEARFLLTNRGLVRLHEQMYGFPRLLTQAQLDSAPRFFLFSTEDELPGGYRDPVVLGGRLFPRHQARRVNDRVTVFERTSAP